MAKAIRVLHILNDLRPSGAETMLKAAAHLWQDQNIICEILATGKTEGSYACQLRSSGYPVHHIPYAVTPKFIFKFARFIINGKFDVVHIHSESVTLLCGLICRIIKKSVTRTIHSIFSFKLSIHLRMWIKRKIVSVIGVKTIAISGPVAKNELLKYNNKTKIIINWYDDGKFWPNPLYKKLFIREKFGIPENAFLIVSVGNCSLLKNHEELIYAFSELRKHISCWYLHIGEEDHHHTEQKLALKLCVEKNISFAGIQDEVAPLIAAADVYVMPSLVEGLSIAAMEAIAMGLPVIFSDIPGLINFKESFPDVIFCQPDRKELLCSLLLVHGSLSQLKKKMEINPEVARRIYGSIRGVMEHADFYKTLV